MIEIVLEDLLDFNFTQLVEMQDWLIEHLGESRIDDIGRWTGGSWFLHRVWRPVDGYQRVPRHYGRWVVQFANEQDATLFRLRWS